MLTRPFSNADRFLGLGVFFGLLFPGVALPLAAWRDVGAVSFPAMAEALWGDPLLWIIMTAPFFLGALAWFAGRRQDELVLLTAGQEAVIADRTRELAWRATHDALTGLPNRTWFVDHVEQHLEQRRRITVFYFDLDHFKVINDSLGHHAGDQLLGLLGERLRDSADAAGIQLARIGGDEFAGVMPACDDADATAGAQGLLESVAQPFEVAGRSLNITASVGLAYSTEAQQTQAVPRIVQSSPAERLLGAADRAVYRAKQLGRNRFVVHDQEMREAADRRFEVEFGIRRALETSGFLMHYQPVVQLPGAGVAGVEALVRWRRPDGVVVGPGEFLDVAVEAGLMCDIAMIAYREAFTAARRLADRGRPITVSVNASAVELGHLNFADGFLQIIAESGLSPRQVGLEITESAVLVVERTIEILQQLRQAGVRILLDDFGTGFSSLAHLRELPIDVVKIDRSFVAALLDDEVTRSLTKSVIDLCRVLGLDVVLEGVETAEQAIAIQGLGGRLVQGFHYHRPMPLDELATLLGVEPDRESDGPEDKPVARNALPQRTSHRPSTMVSG